MVKCRLCNKELGKITKTHLWHNHGMQVREYMTRFPGEDMGPMPWMKGETKQKNLSLQRLSNTLKAKKEWNFSQWRKENKNSQNVIYKKVLKNDDLAELIGVILGDGNLNAHVRTENLRITCNSNETAYIRHISSLIRKVFDKVPAVRKRNDENAVSIDLYQCKISQRVDLPCGNKIKNNVGIPAWIFLNKHYLNKCLKGLFETDGCFHEDKKNHTRCIEFKNNCKKLREDVFNGLKILGYNPQFGKNYIRLVKKREVFNFKTLIDFRNYN